MSVSALLVAGYRVHVRSLATEGDTNIISGQHTGMDSKGGGKLAVPSSVSDV